MNLPKLLLYKSYPPPVGGRNLFDFIFAKLLFASEDTTLRIVSQPQNYSGKSGTNATFTVVASGVGLTYQWYFSNNQGATWSVSSLTGNQTDTLTVGIKASRNGQMYRCVVTDANEDSITSDPATLTMTT